MLLLLLLLLLYTVNMRSEFTASYDAIHGLLYFNLEFEQIWIFQLNRLLFKMV